MHDATHRNIEGVSRAKGGPELPRHARACSLTGCVAACMMLHIVCTGQAAFQARPAGCFYILLCSSNFLLQRISVH